MIALCVIVKPLGHQRLGGFFVCMIYSVNAFTLLFPMTVVKSLV